MTPSDFWRRSLCEQKCWCRRPGWKPFVSGMEKVVQRARKTWCRSCSTVSRGGERGSGGYYPHVYWRVRESLCRGFVCAPWVWRWDGEHKVSRSKVKVGTIKGHEYSTIRTDRSTGWSQINICTALEIPENKATFWVDSVNIGFWVQVQNRKFKPFVSHRVGEIHGESSPDQWRYVATKLNPADQGTRGASVQELATYYSWWHGPSFLQCGEDEWPERKFGKAPES